MEALDRANSDLQNLLDSTQIATLFLDTALHISHFTPAISTVVPLRPSDRGRPLADLAPRFADVDLVREAADVLRTLGWRECSLRTRDGDRRYLLRLGPYRTVANVIDGVVLTFTDVTALTRAEEAARAAQAYAESVLETVRTPLLILDADLRVRSANRAFYDLFHVIPVAMEGRRLAELGHGLWDLPALHQRLAAVLAQHQAFEDFEVAADFPPSGLQTLLLSAREVIGATPNTALLLLAIEDITVRQQAEAERQRLEREAQRVAHFALLGRLAAGVSHEIHNPLGAVFLNVDLLTEELAQTSPDSPAVLAEALAELKTNLARVDNLLQDYLALIRVHTVQRQVQDLGVAVAAWGRAFQGVAAAHGVTLQLDGVEALGSVAFHASTLRRALLNLVQNAAEAMPQGGTVTLAGQGSAELHETIAILAEAGLEAARLVVSTGKGKQVMDQARTVIREMENGERALFTQRTVATDRQARTTLALLFYADVLAGVLVAGAGYALNRALTKRQYAEQALQGLNAELEQQVAERTAGLQQAEAAARAQREYLQVTLASIGDAVIVTDAAGCVRFLNGVAQALTGWPADAAAGQPLTTVFRIINEHTRQPVDNPVDLVRRTGTVVGLANHTVLLRRDGSAMPIDDSAAPIRDEHGSLQGVVLVFRDITVRRQAETALQQANADLEQRVEARTALLEMLLDITRAANEAPSSTEALQYAVDRLCAYTGWPVGHVYRAAGAARWAPTAVWHLDASERLTAFQQATQTVEFGAGEGLIGRVGILGKPEWRVDVATDPAFQRRHAALEAGLKAGVAVPIVVGPEVVGVLEFYASESLAPDPPLLDALTQIGIQLGRAVERERAAARAQRQQEALVQREKLAAMGELLASVAHELNNPLAVILLQADLLRADAGSGALAESVEEIAQAATRCERLVRQFLTLTRQHVPERTTVDLHALITSTMEFLTPPLQVDTIAADLRFAADLPLLGADPYQLQQVLVNLVTNAHQALRNAPPPRQVTLTTRCDPTRTRVTLEVADTGPGMPLEIQERIFEPFFTTKPLGVGTGLGLPLCQGIIASHGGTIRVTSQPGQGTTFQVELPVGVVPETAPPAQPGTMPRPPVPRLAILLVDDEPRLASTLARLLRRDGHTVDTAANGRLALARLAERAYDLVLCDVRMPELDGPSLYRLLERQQPHLCQRLIFLTGDTLEPATRAFLEASGAPCLTKPFSIAEARRVIQRTLQVAALSAPGTRPA